MDSRTAPFELLHVRPLEHAHVPHGRLAAVSLPVDWPFAELPPHAAPVEAAPLLASLPHAAERELAARLAAPRRIAFTGGRLALRAAITAVAPDRASEPILRTTRGAPSVPDGTVGSVSHKRGLAVAVAAARSDAVHTLGVDLEETPDEGDLARPDLAPRILTALERRGLESLQADDPLAYRVAVRLRFALKEAVYKAIDPHVQRYVRFQEVEVFPEAAGETRVLLALPEFARRTITVRAWWSSFEGHLLATASATRPAG